jgi:membrane protease YdiL (CAAX protease family)
MIIHFKFLIKHFIAFFKDPAHPNYVNLSTRQKLRDIGFYYLTIQFIICAIILWYPVEIAEKLGLYNKLEEIDVKIDISFMILLAVILAPLIEEGIFRLFLGRFRNKPYFNWVYYISSLLFGWIHFFNYQFDQSHYFFLPFITMTQTFGGFMLGYIRIMYGFWYGVLLHSLFNCLGVIFEYVVGQDL